MKLEDLLSVNLDDLEEALKIIENKKKNSKYCGEYCGVDNDTCFREICNFNWRNCPDLKRR